MDGGNPAPRKPPSLFSRENIAAFLLFLLLCLLIIFSAESSPLWIYQGF